MSLTCQVVATCLEGMVFESACMLQQRYSSLFCPSLLGLGFAMIESSLLSCPTIDRTVANRLIEAEESVPRFGKDPNADIAYTLFPDLDRYLTEPSDSIETAFEYLDGLLHPARSAGQDTGSADPLKAA